ncbi:MAG: AMP-binding protein [Pseudomonadota bacterium]|nr:AMP-binding protein [Pseudomonadota bacterium]
MDVQNHDGLRRIAWRTDRDRQEIESYSPWHLLPGDTIYDCLAASAAATPDKTAVSLLDREDATKVSTQFTYAAFVGDIRRAACLFARTCGDATPVVTVIAPLHPEGLIATWAAETVGIANPINPYLDIDSVAAIMTTAGSNILVVGTAEYGPGLWDKLEALREKLPGLKAVFTITEGDAETRFRTALDGESADGFEGLRRTDGDADATYMPTGGTTGVPKLVRHSQKRQLLDAWLMGALMGCETDEVVGQGMPHFHVGGLVAASLRAMLFGQSLVLFTVDGFRHPHMVGRFWDVMTAHGITNLIAAPTSAAAILGQKDADHSGNVIRTFGCGGSTVPAELLRAFHKRFALYLRELWGMTEFHGVTTGHPSDGTEPMIGSVGKAFPFHRVVAAELDGQRFRSEAPHGSEGVLIAQGPCIGEGYLDNPTAGEELWVSDGPGGGIWASTGDIGSMDAEGHIWVHGRQKDLIIRGGHNIDPKVIEEALQHHEAVQVSAAIGKPDATRGEMPVAFVQLKDGAKVTPEELIEFCRTRISERAAVPVEITLIPAMPMTAVGKIAKPDLREIAGKAVVEDVLSTLIDPHAIRSIDFGKVGKRQVAHIRLAADPDTRTRIEDAFTTYEFGVDLNYDLS